MAQTLAELAAQQKAIRDAAAGKKADPPMEGLKAAAPPTTVKIVGDAKAKPDTTAHDAAVARQKAAVAKSKAKKAQGSGY